MTQPANQTPTQEQLTRALLDEVRSIKTILMWALLGIPGAVLLVWVVSVRLS